MALDELKTAMDAAAAKVRDLKAAKEDIKEALAALVKSKEDYLAAGGVVETPAGKKKKSKGAAPAAAPAASADADAEAKKRAKEAEKEAKKAARKSGKAAATESASKGDAPAAKGKPAAAGKGNATAAFNGDVVFASASKAIKVAAAIASLKTSADAAPAPTIGAPMPAGTPAVQTADGVVAGTATVLSFCCEQSDQLKAATPLEAAQIQTWLSLCVNAKDVSKDADAALLHRTFLAGNHLTAADLAVFEAVHPTMAAKKGAGFVNLTRWFELIQHTGAVKAAFPALGKGTTFFVPTIEAGAGDAKLAAKKGEKKAPKAEEAPKTEAKAEGRPELSPEQIEKAAANKKAKDEKKAMQAKAAKPAKGVPAPKEWNVSHLKIVVGTIVKAWEHPDSEKLWCEEIDCGEETTRQIASGLRKYYPEQSSLTGRKVLVLANLKPKKLGGFPSNGMVLCASSADKSKTIFVEVPSGAPNGERVQFPGFEGEAATPAQMDKKKVFETVAPMLIVDDAGTCTGAGVPFTTSAGMCTAPGLEGSHIA